MVGSKKPNGFGLYDIFGNVEELCADEDYDIFAGYLMNNRYFAFGGDYFSEECELTGCSTTIYKSDDGYPGTGFRPAADITGAVPPDLPMMK